MRIAVVGCGGVGLNVVQGAAIARASTIVAADLHQAKRDFAIHLGATHAAEAAQLLIMAGTTPDKAAEIMSLFDTIHDAGNTIVMVTHDLELAKKAKRMAYLKDGEIIKQHKKITA